MKKTLFALTAAAGFAVAAPASAAIVGGVDFGDGVSGHLETATLAQTYINGNGQNATAYGFITTVNGNASYCSTGAGCGLFYVANFYNSQNFSAASVEFTSAEVQVFFYDGGSSINLLSQASPDNVAMIQAMTPWVTLGNHGSIVANGTLTGSTLTGFANGLLDVTGGIAEVAAFLDGNNIGDGNGGKADIAYTASFNNFTLSQKDIDAGLTVGCADGQAAVGAWCYQGTSNLRGDTVSQVPVPAPLSLLGMGLLGLGFAARTRKA